MVLPGKHIHIVGVGGFGMSAIARVLLQRGYAVSGSDLRANDLTQALRAFGATIYQGHNAAHLHGADLVVATSAATDDNPEIMAARAQGIPVLRRRDMLGDLMAQQTGIAIAGTHGKTTTTALLAHVLITAGLDPTYIVGGVMHNTGTNAGAGAGDHFVIEADEYDRMFLGLRPQIAVITNIEHDHPDCYPTLDDVYLAFEQFVALLPKDGVLVACADNLIVRELGSRHHAAGKRVVWYGLAPLPDAIEYWTAGDLVTDAACGMCFTVHHAGKKIGRLRLNLSGRHNVQNALAVLAVSGELGLSLAQITPALDNFQGTRRRGEIIGTAGGVTMISDYAHHPTAIQATLAAYRARPGVRTLWAVWQPHTYTRLRTLPDRFATAFTDANRVLITDVYSVRETVMPGLDAADMADKMQAAGHKNVRYTGTLEATTETLIDSVRPGDVVLLLSAGDLPQIGPGLLDRLEANA